MESLSTHSEMRTGKTLSKAEVAARGQMGANENSCFGAEEEGGPAAPRLGREGGCLLEEERNTTPAWGPSSASTGVPAGQLCKMNQELRIIRSAPPQPRADCRSASAANFYPTASVPLLSAG